MRSFLADLRRHPRAVSVFLSIWVLVSIVTILTWQYRDGYAFGMHPYLIPFQFLLPVLAGAMVANWPRNGVLEGMAAGLLTLVIQLPFGLVMQLLGKIEPGSESMLEAVPFMLVGMIIGGWLGALGAALTRLVTRLGGGWGSGSGRHRAL